MLLAFDTTRVLQIWYVLHAAAGFVCMWILARHELRLSREGAFVASGAWAFAGTHALHFTGSGFHWAAAMYMPLAIFLWRRAERDLRAAVGLAILMSLEFYGGAVYPIMITSVILAGETLTRVWRPSRIAGIARAAVVAGVAFFFLSASRVIPVIYQARSHHRTLDVEIDVLQWSTLKDMFLARTHTRWVTGQRYVWPEYGNYLGEVVVGFAFLGVLLGGADNLWVLFVGEWAFLFMLGHAGSWAPWHILKAHIYPFKEMRVPSRFTVPVGMFLAAFAGIGVDRVSRVVFALMPSRRVADAARMAAFGIAVVGIGDLCTSGYPWIAESYIGKPLAKDIPISARLWDEGLGRDGFANLPQQNRARIECWDEWAFEREAALWQGDVPQAKTTSPGATITGVTRTQNTFVVDVDASAPARVILNSTFDLAWRSNVGQVVDNAELLAVDVPAGQHHVLVKYWPRGLTAGFVLTFLGIAGAIAFFAHDRRRRLRQLHA